MSVRMRRPATARLELSQGDYLIVKQHLTAGEHHDWIRASTRPVALGGPGIELDPVAAGVALVLAYLLDWSFQDAEGRPLVIADQPPQVVQSALNHIDADAYMEVQTAIQQHQAAMTAVVEDQKKTQTGVPAPDRTLTSVA